MGHPKQNPKVEWVLITPEIAKAWLKQNTINRDLNNAHVVKLAGSMGRGEWTQSHQGIARDYDGNLLDGQHRLAAIVMSGVSVYMLVMTGLPTESIKYIDQQKKRLLGDTLGIFGKLEGVDYTDLGGTKKVSETLNMLQVLISNSNSGLSVDQANALISQFRDGIAFANIALPVSKAKIGSAPIKAAVAFAYKTSPIMVTEFVERFRTGANVGEGDPALILRNVILGGGLRNAQDRRTVAVKALNAIGYFLMGEKIRSLFATEDAVAYFGLAHGLSLRGSSAEGAPRYARQVRAALKAG